MEARVGADEDSKRIFPFFKLSGELRNNIYDHALTKTKDSRLECGLFLRAEDIPITNLRLVSKAFKAEYDGRVRSYAKIIINDDFEFDSYHITVELPPGAAKVPNLHINLLCVFPHRSWIKELISEMPKLNSLAIQMIIWEEEPDEEEVKEGIAFVSCQGYQELRCLRSFDVYYGDHAPDDSEIRFSIEGAKKLLSFSPEKKCFEKVEDAEAGMDEGGAIGEE